MYRNNKFRKGNGKGKKRYHTRSEKASFYAGLKVGKRIARSRRNSFKRR